MVIGSKLCEKDIFEVCFIITHVEKNIFLKNQKKVNFSKSAGGRPSAGLDFGDLVSQKVKKLKIELFERFSIKSGLTDV